MAEGHPKGWTLTRVQITRGKNRGDEGGEAVQGKPGGSPHFGQVPGQAALEALATAGRDARALAARACLAGAAAVAAAASPTGSGTICRTTAAAG